MKWGIMAIITIGLLFAGVYGAMAVHGGSTNVDVKVYVVSGDERVSSVSPGDNVKIAVKIENKGDTAFALSSHAPVFAYANIYRYNGGNLEKVESVKFESKYVAWHVVSLDPGRNYTAYIDWTVPTNVSGILYIEAWAGSAPKANTTITVETANANSYSNEYVDVYTDDVVYFAGDVVHITVVNDGDSPAMFGSGFEVEDSAGNVVAQKAWRHNVVLQPGQSVEYTWTVPDDIDSGFYYIYVGSSYAVIYIY